MAAIARCRQRLGHRRGASRDAASLFGRRDLIADVRTSRRTQTLTSPVRSEEYPSAACERRTERLECLFAQHARRASVVVHDCGKRPCAFWLVHDSVKRELPTRKRDDISRDMHPREEQEREDDPETVMSHDAFASMSMPAQGCSVATNSDVVRIIDSQFLGSRVRVQIQGAVFDA